MNLLLKQGIIACLRKCASSNCEGKTLSAILAIHSKTLIQFRVHTVCWLGSLLWLLLGPLATSSNVAKFICRNVSMTFSDGELWVMLMVKDFDEAIQWERPVRSDSIICHSHWIRCLFSLSLIEPPAGIWKSIWNALGARWGPVSHLSLMAFCTSATRRRSTLTLATRLLTTEFVSCDTMTQILRKRRNVFSQVCSVIIHFRHLSSFFSLNWVFKFCEQCERMNYSTSVDRWNNSRKRTKYIQNKYLEMNSSWWWYFIPSEFSSPLQHSLVCIASLLKKPFTFDRFDWN